MINEFRDNKDEIVTLSIGELDDLVWTAGYRAANKATSSLFKGLSRAYFNQWNDDIETILKELEQIKLNNNNF